MRALQELVVALLIGVMTLSGVAMARSFAARIADPLGHATLCLPDDTRSTAHDCADCTLGGAAPAPAQRFAGIARLIRAMAPIVEIGDERPDRFAALLPWSRGPPAIA